MKKIYNLYVIIAISIPLFLFSVTKGLDRTNDIRAYYENYIRVINNNLGRMEKSFELISMLGYRLFGEDLGFRSVLFFYSFFSFFLIIYIAYKFSNYPLITFWLYISLYFLLHICIQIRAGLAILIFLWSVEDIVKHNKINYFLKSILCTFFHMSGFICFLIYPFIFFTDKKKFLLLILPIICYFIPDVLLIILDYLEENIDNKHIIERIVIYTNENNLKMALNIFNIYYLFVIILYYVSLLKIYKYYQYRLRVYQGILCLSVCVMGFSRIVPIIGYRGPEFLNIVLVLFIPGIYKHVAEKWIITCLFYAFSIFMIFNYTIRHPLIHY